MSHSENEITMSDKDNNCNNGTSSPSYRLCHIVKRPDFDGYGFNLHSEKGKPGQYIGKVDEKSPAEQAGLRQGDRIIEVNGMNIGNDTHKQVVQRIKAITNEVRLLVIDPVEYEKLNKQNNNKILNETITITTTTIPPKNETNQKVSDADKKAINDRNNKAGSVSPTTSTKSQTNSINSASNKTDSSTPTLASTITIGAANGHSTMDSTDGSNSKMNIIKMNEPSSSGNNGNDNSMMGTDRREDFKSNGNSASSQQQKSGLNLPMTAAEMRAKLQAKKKYDPKNDSVDLRKKFEIIQKL